MKKPFYALKALETRGSPLPQKEEPKAQSTPVENPVNNEPIPIDRNKPNESQKSTINKKVNEAKQNTAQPQTKTKAQSVPSFSFGNVRLTQTQLEFSSVP